MGANIKPLKSYKQYGVPKVNVALQQGDKKWKTTESQRYGRTTPRRVLRAAAQLTWPARERLAPHHRAIFICIPNTDWLTPHSPRPRPCPAKWQKGYWI